MNKNASVNEEQARTQGKILIQHQAVKKKGGDKNIEELAFVLREHNAND